MPAADNPPLPKKYYALFNEEEWNLLDFAAKQDGKKDIRRFLTAEFYRLQKKLAGLEIDCSKKPKRKKNIYHIPDELQPFFQKLTCVYGRTVSEIITRLIIMPRIIEAEKILKENDAKKTA